jgi:uncharacterized protein YjdB
MKQKKTRGFQIILFVLLCLILAGTGSIQAEAAKTVKVKKVSLNKTTMTVYKGQTKKLKATITPKKATNQKVKWKSKDKKTAIVDGKGNVTGVNYGTTYIVVYAKENSKIKAKCKVVVKAAALKDMTLEETQAEVDVGKTKKLKCVFTPTYAANKSVSWESSNTKVATVSSKGVVTGVKTGKATITCTSKENSTIVAKCEVKVIRSVTSIQLAYTSYKLESGIKTKLTATISPANATYKTITWTSSDKSIVAVDKNGTITAKKAGTATITATAHNGVVKKCKIRVANRITTGSVATKTAQCAMIIGVTDADSKVTGFEIKNHRSIANMTTGTYYTITGQVVSDYDNWNLCVEVIDKNGTVYSSYEDKKLSAGSYDLQTQADAYIYCNLLPAGTYYYRVWVSTSTGVYKMLVCERFDVVDSWGQELYLKQAKGSYNCTSVSAAMMIRSYAALQGKDWSQISLASVEAVCWRDGLISKFTYTNSTIDFSASVIRDEAMKTEKMTMEEKKQYLKDMLEEHPEGFVIYDESTPHAVFLTDYDSITDTFYVADPVDNLNYYSGTAKYINNYGRIPLYKAWIDGDDTQTDYTSQEQIISVLDKVWYVVE